MIAAAVAAPAAFIVTGNRKHLLPIGVHEGIAIVAAVQTLAILGVAPGAAAAGTIRYRDRCRCSFDEATLSAARAD